MAKEKDHRRLSTSQLLTFIKKSGTFAQVSETLPEVTEQPIFCHYLYEVMNQHQKMPKDVIQDSGLERSYFYHILNGQKVPSRNVIIRISLCIFASLNETNQLLRLANQGVLYPRIRRDAAIIFCIENHYTMHKTNELLLEYHELPLYREE